MKRCKRILRTVLFGGITCLQAVTAQAVTLNIADVPLFLGGLVEPNIMFTLDDSGSMHWEMMPDRLIWSYYVFPRANHVYGGSDYTDYTVSFNTTNNIYGIWVRSSSVNRIYYNPAITYLPWVNSDGTTMSQADITCALHNPYNPDAGCRDLTTSNTQAAHWEYYNGTMANFPSGASSPGTQTQTFWPATYYVLNEGGDIDDPDDFTKVEIKPGSTYTGSAARTDCENAPTCTYDEEIQNFANWYTYYRSRILLARAGAGRAFARQGTDIRVGFGSINHGTTNVDGVNTRTVIKGVRPFSGSDREDFFDSLYSHVMPTAGTPLRRALDDVGKYFQRNDNQGPWGQVPGTNDSTPHLTCRQSYNILMTDGYWNSDAASTSGATNADDVNGPEITGPDGQSYQYTPSNPYQDGFSNTLADVAMYYWNRDLRTDLANEVPTNLADPAFWQHLVNFTVGLGVTGTLDPATDLEGLSDGSISWPDPNEGGEATVDDLWHAAVNSRGGFLSAANPSGFADALADTLTAIGGRTSSAAAIATNSARLDSNTFVYQARFDSADWHGELLAFKIDEETGEVLMPDPSSWSTPNKSDDSSGSWEAGALLMDKGWASRELFTYNPDTSSGVTFEWDNLSSDQQSGLDHGDGRGALRLDYIAGDQSQESVAVDPFRTRSTILGDIVHSDPWFVGTEDYGYSILPGSEGSEYVDYRLTSDYQNRPGVIYVGANDGMLHAFDAATGDEKFAYVPGSIVGELWRLTDPGYDHRYFVDGTAKSSDVYVGGYWKTYLVGTMGAGGKTVFTLDVTDPDNFDENDVVWEFTPEDDDVDANGVPDATDDGVPDGDLGFTMGQASIARMANGKWAAIFGNGYSSDNQQAVLFIVDISNGEILRKIYTGAGGVSEPNGLSTPLVVDRNNDGIADRIYAGDLLGNLWSFDVTDEAPANWGSAYHDGGDPAPFFVAEDESGNRQPITAKPEAKLHPYGGIMVYFGTGKYFEVGDGATSDHNTLYGVRDQGDSTVSRSDLLEQRITHELNSASFANDDGDIFTWDVRVTTKYSVDWSTQGGWYMDLALQDDSDGNGIFEPPVWEGERVVSVPLLLGERVVFSTMIPDPNPCAFGGSGWLMELSALDGARLDQSPFDLNNSGTFDTYDYVTVTIPGPGGSGEPQTIAIPVSGKKSKVGIIKTPAVIKAGGGKEYKYQSGSTGDIEKTVESSGGYFGRQSWRQIR